MSDGVGNPINNSRNGYGVGAYGADTQRSNIIISFNSNESLSTISSNNGKHGNTGTGSTNGQNIATDLLLWFKGLFGADGSTVSLLDNQSGSESRRTLTTWSGVFAPVALGIFSTTLFLRMGFVVGQSGILVTIVQLFLAYTILLLTVFSICAISTNGAVEGGGAYYMISRALGPEFGGSIGFLFFVANVLSCALYITGFVEAIVDNFAQGGHYVGDDDGLPTGFWFKYLYSSVVLLACLVVCLIGGSMFAKTLTVILGITVICTFTVFFSIFYYSAKHSIIQVGIPKENDLINQTGNISVMFNFTGLSSKTFRDNLKPDYTMDYSTDKLMNFSTVFAIMFSSVTGIMNGANMSGELKDPSKSIPRGTLAAVGFTFCTYMLMGIVIGGSCERALLINNYIFLQDVNVWSYFVIIGIFAATLSAALGNLIGASRVLEALACDQLFWFVLKPATITTRGGNPYVAVLITWVLVQLVLLVNSLNAIAPATSVFFLLSYASTNLACMALDLASAPNFRPTFKYFSWHTCFMGMAGCMTMCFLINPIYTSIAIIIMLVLIILLHFRSLPSQWGSISQALIFHQVRKYLLMLDIRKAHVKYWRPQILLMVSRPRQSCELIDFINDLKKGGLYILGHVKVGDLNDYSERDPLLDEYPKWMKLVDKLNIKAFVELTLTKTVPDGLQHLIRSAGLGGMKTNTVCLGFYDDGSPVDSLARRKPRKKRFFGQEEDHIDVGEHFGGLREHSSPKDLGADEYVKMIEDALKMQKNVLLCRHFNMLDKSAILNSKGTSYIDVWPVNFFRPETASYFDNTCLFLLQLACVINMVPGWKSRTKLRVFLFINTQNEQSQIKEQKLEAYLRQLRILAKIQTVTWDSIPHDVTSEQFDNSVNYSDSRMQEYNEINSAFLSEINKLIVHYSSMSAVSFLYLPRPPDNKGLTRVYLQQLEGLTENLPPTVMVHGLHPVTSTTL